LLALGGRSLFLGSRSSADFRATGFKSPERSAEVVVGREESPVEAEGGYNQAASVESGFSEILEAAGEEAVGSENSPERPSEVARGGSNEIATAWVVTGEVAAVEGRTNDQGPEHISDVVLDAVGSPGVAAEAGNGTERRLGGEKSVGPAAESGMDTDGRSEEVGIQVLAEQETPNMVAVTGLGVGGGQGKVAQLTLKVKGRQEDATEAGAVNSPKMGLIPAGQASQSECLDSFFDSFGNDALNCKHPPSLGGQAIPLSLPSLA
jgi:hypothetical protein